MGTYRWKPHTLLVSAEEVGRKMKLEAGKYYKTRDGRKVGPMRELDRRQTDFPWTASEEEMPENRYSDTGHEIGTDFHSGYTIISEWPSSDKSPIREVTRRELVAGVYGRIYVAKQAGSDRRLLIKLANIDGNTDQNTIAHGWSLEELREAAHTLNQIAEYLSENEK